MTDDPIDDALDPFADLCDRFTDAVRRGEAPSVDDWAAEHPEQSERIRELFPTILAMEGAREAAEPGPARLVLGPTDRLGDFRILREVGRGGMGVVYEAVQESLGRRVAVKLLPSFGDVRRVRRFEREARTAAGLHHTNIVPIFGVGEQDGWHYYVMQVIHGVGLDAVIAWLRDEADGLDAASRAGRGLDLSPAEAVRALRTGRFRPATDGSDSSSRTSGIGSEERAASASPPSSAPDQPPVPDPGPPLDPRARYWRSVASIGRQVAGALAYAHVQGVLHRDIKPANLLLDAHGVVWVTDFGLAKAIEQDALTRSGDLVGTLQYMAPEQLKSEFDARSDVYALGLTLYELLTLTPAFRASERGQLLERIAAGRTERPAALRPGIPRDLETIVLKAMAPDPRHRYRDAAALADDLRRFLEDRPVLARRATAIEHAWRWCRRNKAVAALAFLALLGVLGAAVTGWIGYASTRAALREAKEAREEADVARRDAEREAALAESNLQLARQAIEEVFETVFGGDRLDGIELVVDDSGDEAAYEWVSGATASPEDAALLERMLAFYGSFAEANADSENSAELLLESARAHRRVGDIQLRLGRADDARNSYTRALELRGRAGRDDAGVAGAALHNRLARAAFEAGDVRAAQAECRAVLETLAAETGTAARYETARAHELLGATAIGAGWAGRDIRARLRGGRPQRRNGGSPPAVPRFAGPLREPGPPQPAPANERIERLREGVASLKQAYEIDRGLAAAHPDNTVYQISAAHTGRIYAEFLLRVGAGTGPAASGATADGERLIAELTARLRELVARSPEVGDYRRELVELLLVAVAPSPSDRRALWRTWREPDGSDDAAAPAPNAALAEAVAIAEQLVADHPDVIDYRRSYARALRARIGASLVARDWGAALETVPRAIPVIESLGDPFATRHLEELRVGQLFAATRHTTFDAAAVLAALEHLTELGEADAAGDPRQGTRGRRPEMLLRALLLRLQKRSAEIDPAMVAAIEAAARRLRAAND